MYRRKTKNILTLKFEKKKFFIFCLLLILIFISVGTFLYFSKQDSKLKQSVANLQVKKDENFYRRSGGVLFKKMRQMISENKNLSDAQAIEFQKTSTAALSNYRKAKELNPKNYLNHLALAKICDFLIPYMEGIEKEAAENYLEVVKNMPNDYETTRSALRVFIILADNSFILGDKKTTESSLVIAKTMAQKFLQDDPTNLPGIYYSALIARREGDINFATSTLEHLKLILDKEPDLHFELAIAYFSVGNFPKAKTEFETASRLSSVYKKNSVMYLKMIEEKMSG